MATAEELLTMNTPAAVNAGDEVLTADLNTRVISIPATVGVLGVESDDDVKRLRFSVPRHYGEIDLYEFEININFENARGGGDFYPVDDKTVDGDFLTFSWLVDRSAFAYAGEVTFNICFKKYDDEGNVVKELNTTTASLQVLTGLETSREVVEQNPSAFDVVMFRLYAVEAATGNGQNGYYTVVKVDETEEGITVTVIDKDGETVGVIRHGIDGYVPVKGVDYWTEEDKSEIKTEVKTDVETHTEEYINTWAPRSTSVTLVANNWVDNRQTVTVAGVTTDNIIIVAPIPVYDNYKEYAERNVRCVSQSNNTLTFECQSVPATDLNVNVAVYYSSDYIADESSFTVTDDGNGNVTIS